MTKKSRSIKPDGYFGVKDTALFLGVTIAKLNYLCKTGRIEFITSEGGTRWFNELTVDILPKLESDKPKTSGVPEGYVSVQEVSEMIGCNIQKVYRLIKAGKIKPANFSKFTKRICIDPRFIELDGVNCPPKISEPKPVSEEFQNVDKELDTLTSIFTTIKNFLQSSAQNAEECFEDESIAYAKNALMYRIQNLVVNY